MAILPTKRDLVAALANDAPLSIAWLESLGMIFNKYEDGRTVVRSCGGSSRKRLQSSGDMTGAEIMRVVRDEVRNRGEQITTLEFSPAVELLLDKDGKCSGAILYNMETKEFSIVLGRRRSLSPPVVSAVCTSKVLPPPTTMAPPWMAWLWPIETVLATRISIPPRSHPTGVAYPEQNVGLLITEKVRGLGTMC